MQQVLSNQERNLGAGCTSVTLKKKTYKDQREEKDLHLKWRSSREGKRPQPKEKGGRKNHLLVWLAKEDDDD